MNQPERTMVKPLVLVGLGVLAAFLVWLLAGSRESAPPVGSIATDAAASGPKPVAAVGPELAERKPVRWRITVRDAASSEPIEGAVLSMPADQETQLSLDESQPRSDADGMLVWDTRPVGDAFVVADGYLPHPLVAADLAAESVALRAGGSIRVRVLSTQGNPMEGVKLVLRGSTSADRSIPSAEFSIGNPFSVDPEWVVQTDAKGEAVFRGLPQRKLKLNQWLEGHHPLTTQSAHYETTPPAEITLVMAEVWGCVAEIPAGLQVARWEWTPQGELDRGIHVLTSLPPNLAALERRFPNCICVAGVPSNVDVPVVMTCRATMTNGTVWEVSWPLSRWKEITPVFLEQDLKVLAREIHFKVVDPRGKPLEVPMSVYDRIRRSTISVVDSSCWLEDGSYKVVPKVSSPWFKASLANPDFEVGPGLPESDTVYLQLRESLHRVEVRLRVEAVGADAPVRVRFLDEKLANATILHRPSDKDPCVMYLPAGKYKIRAASFHHAAPEQEVEVQADLALTLEMAKIVR